MGKLRMVGTPNQGTRFAALARDVLDRDLKFALKMSGVTAADYLAFTWLASDDGKGKENPRLKQLNDNFARQEAQVESIYTLGGNGIATPTSDGPWPLTGGDGLVEAKRLAPPGGRLKILPGEKHHGFLPSDPDVYREMIGYFGWQTVSASPSQPATGSSLKG